MVLINGYVDGLDAPFISNDDINAMEFSVSHLVSLGHQKIGMAVGQDRYVPTQRKITGFQRAMARLLGDNDPPIAASFYTVEGGGASARTLLDAGCTAIVCGSDLMALGAIRTIRATGLSVPDDVSVTGYDDSQLIAFTDPPLTTVRQPVLTMGRAAVQSLMGEIRGSNVPRTEFMFAPELVVRASTARASESLTATS